MTSYLIISVAAASVVFASVVTTIGWAIRTAHRDHPYNDFRRRTARTRTERRLAPGAERRQAPARSTLSGYAG